jgi:hypothetical protein
MQTSISAWQARCRLKPTRLRHFLADLAHLHGLRCKHPLQQFSDVDTNLGPVTYAARHQRTVRQKVDGAWATSALADYPLELNKVLAVAFAGAIGRLSLAGGARLGHDRWHTLLDTRLTLYDAALHQPIQLRLAELLLAHAPRVRVSGLAA